MSISLFLSMAFYALVTSITPGPVNVVALRYGTRYGVRSAFIYVLGQATGYTLLLLVVGIVAHQVLEYFPFLIQIIQWLGVTFLLFLAYHFLASKEPLLSNDGQQEKHWPFLYGALLQWLNPKAWLCSVAGISAYTMQGGSLIVYQFALIYFVICFLSVGCWAVGGLFLQRFLKQDKHLFYFNRAMALLLVLSAFFLVF